MLKLFSQYIDKFDDDNNNVICYYGMMVIKYSFKRFVMFACLMCVHGSLASLILSSGSNEYQFSFDVKLSLTLLPSFSVCSVHNVLTLYIEGD